MSIRFRLTLVYSTILALTLIVFGVALYSIQAEGTLDALKSDLVKSSERLVEATLKANPPNALQDTSQRLPPPPKPFDEFSGDMAFRDLREREIVRILDAEGNLIASPFGRDNDTLPLSEEGLAALGSQPEWWEEEIVADELMLIYSRPIVRNGQLANIVQVARSLTERNRSLRSLASTLGGAGLISILVAFAVGWVLSKLTLQPIIRITQTAKAIGKKRDFSQRVDYSGPQDEVGQLATTFNQMLTRLQDAYQKVEHSLSLQRSFVADVSHELRTPLTTLRGNLGLLRREPAPPADEQADILADMVEESDRLIRLVNDLLLLAREDAGRSLANEALAIHSVIEEATRQICLLDPQKQITLDVPVDLSILGDRDAFKQVMLVLLDNAIKHSTGKIKISARKLDTTVEIRVQDHGDGISPETLGHVFDRFYRGTDGATGPGLGLGLPIAKALVERIGGAIAIESELGKGSIVILQLLAANSDCPI